MGVAARLAALRDGSAGEQTCLAVRDLVVVCSSSRSGSTMFSELLRRSPDLLTFSAEINPQVTIATLAAAAGCDALADPASYADLGTLRGELGNDLGRPASEVADGAFVRHVAWRLTMQWPLEPIDPALVAGVLLERGGAQSWSTAAFLDVLATLQTTYPSLNPYRYDVPRSAVAERFPGLAPPQGPTAEPVVEMAPFVVPRLWHVADARTASDVPVVTTTPRNAFRLPLLAKAFANARVRVVHLTRNPAAAVNGLRDGWLHDGFFSCRTDTPLDIAGYTDRYPQWGIQWWNYDVPPGWREWVSRPLAEVCGFQWAAAQEATAQGAAAVGAAVHRIAFEDIATPGERRDHALTTLAKWLEVDPAPLVDGVEVPVLMATAAPRPRRWLDNREALQPVLQSRALRELARSLGYSPDPADWE